MHPDEIEALAFAKHDGLLPAIVQHAASGQVLMLGYMNRTALDRTLATGKVTFYSRSRQCLWTKGETSGHVLDLVRIESDCDHDTVLVQALPYGPTCHIGRPSCFPDAPENFLATLDALVKERAANAPPDSYTGKLFAAGVRRIAQKVGEEGVETALAAVAQDDDVLRGEAADLIYHLLVLLRARGLGLADAVAVLAQRHGSKP
jgi:phosphoribosyl-ATP pyrophosphohydrolase/phosphoribosyl-AMP cyclohydrolase